jgi:hypothetical protein
LEAAKFLLRHGNRAHAEQLENNLTGSGAGRIIGAITSELLGFVDLLAKPFDQPALASRRWNETPPCPEPLRPQAFPTGSPGPALPTAPDLPHPAGIFFLVNGTPIALTRLLRGIQQKA